jgi:hypothetical protein
MLDTGPASAITLPARVDVPRPAGGPARAWSDGAPAEARRVGGRRAAPRDSGAPDLGAGANPRFMAQAYAQSRWPQSAPRLKPTEAVAQYPSLGLFSQIIAPGEATPIVTPIAGHLVDLTV